MQNDPQRSKIKFEKRHSIILWRFRVVEGSSRGDGICPPGVDRVKIVKTAWHISLTGTVDMTQENREDLEHSKGPQK